MRRRLNYTKRTHLHKKDITITLIEDSGRKGFQASLHLDHYGLPGDGQIWIEAYDRNMLERHAFGTVAHPFASDPCFLDSVPGSDSCLFRVKVVDPGGHGRLLALAKALRPVLPNGDAPTTSLLRVGTKPLDGLTWSLEFVEVEHPTLFIDETIEAGIALPRQDPTFQALVLPAVLEQVLRQILVDLEYSPEDDPEPDDQWKQQWLDFAGGCPGIDGLTAIQNLTPKDKDRKLDWIEECVSSFARNQSCVRKFRKALGEIDL